MNLYWKIKPKSKKRKINHKAIMHQCHRLNEKPSRLNQNGLFKKSTHNSSNQIIYLVISILICLISNVDSRGDRPSVLSNGQGPAYRTAYACEGRQLKIDCAPNEQINLIRANYGRFSISLCNENGILDWDVQCMSKRSYRVIFDICNGKQNCTMSAKAGLFGEDPCPKTEKYLEAHYQCMPTKQKRRQNKKTLNSASANSNGQVTSTFASVYPTISNAVNKTSLDNINLSSKNSIKNDDNHETTNRPIIEQPSEESVHPNESNLLDTLGYNPISQPLYCSAITFKHLRWNRTQVGKVVEQKCPEGSSGTARWFCGVSNLNLASDSSTRQQAEWLPIGKPDFSECSSRIVQSIERRLSTNHNFVSGGLASQTINLELILQFGKELQQFTSSIVNGQKNPMFSGRIYSDDLLRIAQTLNDLIDRVRLITQNNQDQQKYLDLFAQLLMYIQNIVNDLLDSSYDSWTDLQLTEQRTVSGRLMLALHKVTHLLLFSINKPQDFVNENSNIYISMHLRNSNVMDHFEGRNLKLSSDNVLTTGSSIDLTTRQSTHHLIAKQENSVHIPWRTLVEFGQNNLVRFALIIYKQIDQFIQPNYELFSSIQNPTTISSLNNNNVQQTVNRLQINSDLVALLMTNEPFLQIPGTVFITFKHKQNLTSNSAQLHSQTQYCALWNHNSKQWQTDGCQLIESNSTHSTCECNHLSVYALLRSIPIDEEQKISNHLTNSNVGTEDSSLENILTIGGYQWTFYTNQLKALVTSSCYFSILCLSFVILSLAFIQYRQAKADRIFNKKTPINGTLTDLSLNIHYGTYQSSTNNSIAYGSTNKCSTEKQNQSTFCTHQNLCFVLIVIELLLICSSKTLPTKLDYENRLNCAIFAALLHYLLLSLFVWLLFDVLILHSNIKHHLNQLNLLKSTDYSLPISTISPNLASIQQKVTISSKWLIAIAYGTCSLLLLISVLIDAQSYGSALSSGHCFLTNNGPSYLYLLVLPIFILIIAITITSFSTIKSMAKTRYPLSMGSLQPTKLNGQADLNNSSTNIVLNNYHNQYFRSNVLLCKQLKESIVTVIIISLTWSAAFIYLNSAEKLPISTSNRIGSRSYQLFGILFSVLNIAQATFFVLYYCLLDSTVRKTYYQFYSQIKNSIQFGFSSLLSSFRRKDKVASSLSANTINTTISNATSSILANCNQVKQLTNDLNKAVNPMIDQLNSQQQPIIPPPTSIITNNNINQNTMKPFFLTSSNHQSIPLNTTNSIVVDEPEKCSIDYGFQPVTMANGNLNRNQFCTTSAHHSYQIANNIHNNQLNSSANAYASKIEQHLHHQHPHQIVEHVYESIDGENPYIAKLLSNYQTLGSHLLNHQFNQHQLNHLHKTLRPISSIVQQQQHQMSNIYQQQVNLNNNSHCHLRSLSDLSNISERPLLSTNKNLNQISSTGSTSTALPAIIRDNTKCSTILPNSFQQLNKIKKFHNTLNHQLSTTQFTAQQLNAQHLLKESTLI